MFGRLGMYYVMRQAPLDQHGKSEAHSEPRSVAITAPQADDIGMFLRLAGIIAVVAIAITLVGWSVG